MKSALWKDNLREIKDSFARFFSILIIIMLGVSFFVGIKASGPSIVKTTDAYYQKYQLPDGQIFSTLGLTQEDIKQVNALNGVDVQGMQTLLQTLKPSQETAKFLTYDGNEAHNIYRLMEGRMPETVNEIVLDSKFIESDHLKDIFKIGDTIHLDQVSEFDSKKDYGEGLTPLHFVETEFKVVGFARTPLYMDRKDRGIQGNKVFAVVLDEAIAGDFYSEALFWTQASKNYASYSQDYDQAMDKYITEIEDALAEHPQRRLTQMKKNISHELAINQADLLDAQVMIKETQEDLQQARTDLQEGRTTYDEGLIDLQKGWQELQQGQIDYQSGLEEYQNGLAETANARATLVEQEEAYQKGLAQYNQGFGEYHTRIDQAYQELISGKEAYSVGELALSDSLAKLESGQQAINQAQSQLPKTDNILANLTAQQIKDIKSGQIQQTDPIVAYLLKQQAAHLHQETIRLVELKATLDGSQTALDEEKAALEAQMTELLAQLKAMSEALQIPVDATGLSTVEAVTLYDKTLASALLAETIPQKPLEELQAQLATIQTEMATVQQAINDLAAEKAAIEAAQATNIQNSEALAAAQGELAGVNQAIADTEALIASYSGQIEAAQGQLNELGAIVITPENEAAINEQIANLNALIAQLNAELAATQANLTGLYGSQTTLTGQIETLQGIAELPVDLVRLEEINQALATNQAKLEALTAQEAQLKQAIEDATTGQEPTQPTPDPTVPGMDPALIEQQLQAIKEAQAALDAQQAQIDAGYAAYNQGLIELEAARLELAAGEETLATQEAAGLQELSTAEQELIAGRQALDSGYQQLADADVKLVEAKKALDDANVEIADGFAKYRQGVDDAFIGYAKLEAGERDLEVGERTFNESVQNQYYDLRKGYYEIQKGYNDLDEMEEPNLVVNDRHGFSAYSSVKDNADQLNVISNFFPVIFFLVAILVTFTTIKRMVSEQRTYMGTMLQMGYPNQAIISKFAVYAGISSFIGIVLGIISGYLIFPSVIVNAYNNMHYLDKAMIEVSHFWNFFVAILALATAILPAVIQPFSILQTAPANLLLPEAPRSGKMVFLEKIPFIWKRLSFKKKMTIRNLLRYKGRNAMTLIGVAGCTMLMVTGFGISDTVNEMVAVQSEEIQTFDNFVYLTDDADADQVAEEIAAIKSVAMAYPVKQVTMETNFKNQEQISVNVTVPLGDIKTFNDFIFLRERQHPETAVDLTKGPLMTERLAEHFDVDDATKIELRDMDHQDYLVPINGYVENYLAHYIYVTPEEYQTIFHTDDLKPNLYLVKNEANADAKQVEEALGEIDSVATVLSMSYVQQQLSSAMASLNLITVVLLIAAAGLAFVVLYNLTNINIGERIKELSTIKVLGFYDYEVSLYIYDEILILSVLGGLMGLVLGTILTKILMKTMQTADYLFHPVIEWDGYLWSFMLTIAFSAIVMIVMHFKLKRIDVVEAMKAVE